MKELDLELKEATQTAAKLLTPDRLAKLESAALKGNTLVAFRGSEALCRPYQFEVFFTSKRAIDLGKAVGHRATLKMDRGTTPFYFNGVLSTVELKVQTHAWALYRATLVPKLWNLSLTKHSRVFTKMSVPKIFQEVLKSAGFDAADFDLRLQGDYAPEELVIQYQESKLDFLHRWMEHEGIYYYFEQDEHIEKLVIVDHLSAHDKLAHKRVPYHPISESDVTAPECFDAFNVIHSAVTGKVRVLDYDYARPKLEIAATEAVSPAGFGMTNHHASRFFDPAHAKHYAHVRAQEIQAREVLYHSAGTPLHMSAGYRLDIDDHPNQALNDQSYLAVEVHHFCNQMQEGTGLTKFVKPEYQDVYRVEVLAIDASKQFRPARTTAWPRVWGYDSGVVDGAADSPYAQIDEQGRYLVKFRFDESALTKGAASTYVRMMQPHGGTTEGFHFPLRKGTEVVFTFLGGDPDRPVIAGVVPNATTPSKVTANNYTQNVIQTGSDNFMKLEDVKGGEFIHILCPNLGSQFYLGVPAATPNLGVPASVQAVTGGNAAFAFGGSQHVDVGGILHEHVAAAVTELYDATKNETVASVVTETYNANHITDVAANRNMTVGANQTEDIAANLTQTIGANHSHDVGAVWKVNAGALAKLTAPLWSTTISGITNHQTGMHLHKSGLTVLNQGPTLMTWGPTSGSVASLSWAIPGGAKIVTSSWDVTDPDHKHTAASKKYMLGGYEVQAASQATITGFSSSITGCSHSITGTAIEASGPKISSLAIETKNAGPKAEASAIHCKVSGLISLL
jgi:type VI secretion system secreted protein VgrG